ncbi:hypothetical protein WJX72_010321 [[Myrmecia] bisecta]|uniref:tRNA/rRNA methyltransferase SpoU type domain-containing protein n=1 Tax=[Myrmecia] bisecta TaxID=41462 RepID=A0AAW1PLE3_9CHLO
MVLASRVLAAAGSGVELPVVDVITSINNSYVKHCMKLRTSSSYRQEMGSVLVVGITPILEVTGNGGDIHTQVLFLLDDTEVPEGVQADRVVRVSEPVMRKLSGMDSVQGLQAVAQVEMPYVADFTDKASHAPGILERLLALDGLQDPGNLGTLLRTALALGWQGVFLLPGCCDPFNEKAMRAGRGAAFRVPIQVGDWDDLLRVTRQHGLRCLAAQPHPATSGQNDPADSHSPAPNSWELAGPAARRKTCLVLGSEGQGLSCRSRELCDPITIPMPGSMESLNVSQAGAILMFMLSQGLPTMLSDLYGPRK